MHKIYKSKKAIFLQIPPSVNLLDLLLRSKDAVKRLAQPLAQLLVDVCASILGRNCSTASLQMRHRIVLRHGRVVLVAR